MKRKLYCLPIEIKIRDLDSRLYLGHKLLAKDNTAKVLIGSKGGVHHKMLEYGRNSEIIPVYFSKGTNPQAKNIKLLKEIKKQDGIRIYLDEEGGSTKLDESKFLMRYHTTVLNHLDYIFVWGEKQEEILKRNRKGFPKNRIIVTGHPRFDLRKPFYFEYYSTSNSKIKPPYILVNLNFGLAGSSLNYGELLKLNSSVYKNRDVEFSETTFKDCFQYEKKTRECYIHTIEKIALEKPDLNIIVRPHPSEVLDDYEEIFKAYDNVIVTREGSVQEYITNALAIIHHDCTTAIESKFSGKHVMCYTPVYPSDNVKKAHINLLPIEISDNVYSNNNDLLCDIDLLIDKKLKIKDSLNLLKPYFSNIDFNSASKIVDLLNNNILSQKNNNWFRSLFNFSNAKSSEIPESIKHKKTKLSKSKIPSLTKYDIIYRLDSLNKIEPSSINYTVEKVYDKTFLISVK